MTIAIDTIAAMSEAVARGDSISLVLRHGEKEVVPRDRDIGALLTDRGREDALVTGSSMNGLSRSVSMLKSSPVQRCLQTMEALSEGMEVSMPVVTSRTFGSLDPFIEDLDLVFPYYLRLGEVGLIDAFMGEEEIPGTRSVEEGMGTILREMESDRMDGMGIYVTHDVILAMMVGHLLDERLGREDWVGFLEPLVFVWGDASTSVIWRGSEVDVTNVVGRSLDVG